MLSYYLAFFAFFNYYGEITIENTKISLFKQPKGLFLLCGTELWERFGYYTVQAILILFLSKALGYSDTKARPNLCRLQFFLYITPMIGGYLADRFFQVFQRSILIGGILSFIGYFVLSINNSVIFFLGLSILICANGLFKPNVSAIVGDIYRPGMQGETEVLLYFTWALTLARWSHR